ncbi:MAG: TonB-dependent receptor plug domain-containing protein, partial [Steroidobacteraceae bacterium]
MITSARKPPVTESAPAVLNKGRLLLAVASILGAAAVYADPSPQGTPDSTTATRDEEASGREGSIIGTVTVTGSRIAHPNVASASPVTVMDEAFDHVADTNIIREFHKIPQIQPARGPTQGGGFSGSFVDLRGMGWTRTLVLVNGRRYISTLSGGGVDVSTLPPELIQRAELMTGGGSATYGSDAIAGVLNFILRDDIEGVELHMQTGSTTRGEDTTRHFGLIGGSKFADGVGYGYISLAYDESELILPGNRDYANVVFNNVNGALVPITSTYVGIGVANAPPFGGPAIFNSSGEMFTAPGVINPLTDGDRFNTGVRTNLQQPQELRTLHTGLRYALSDSVELYTEASFIDSETVRSLVSNAVDIVFPVNIDNPFLGPITQAWLADQDTDGDGLVAIPGLRRRFNEVDVGGAITPRTSYRVLVGSRVALAGSWSLDAYYLTQRSRFNWEANGAVGFDQLEQALLAMTDAEGNIVCIDDRFDCVPVDVFSPNGITPEAAAFLHVTPKVKSVNEDTIASATVNGTVMDLPAGPLQVAFGAEYLRFSAEETPDHILSTGRSSAEGFGFVRGHNESNEAFVEADIPLLNERPWAHQLGLQVGARYSDYDISDGAWTYKGMLEWAPVDGFKLRGGVQQAIRQAAVFERFAGDAFLDLLQVDPCFTGAPLTGDLRNACIASGLPAALADSGVTANPDGYIFLDKDIASPDLAPEEADSYTVGFVMDSLGIDDLVVSLDYYDIQLDGGISTFGRDLIFRQC